MRRRCRRRARWLEPGLTSEVDNTPALSFTAGSDNLTSFAFSGIGGLVTDLNGTGGQDIFWQLVSTTQIRASSTRATPCLR